MTPLDLAKKYARLGWKVLPLEPGRKEPIARLVPNGVLNATTVDAALFQWFRNYPRANVGVKCETFLVVDIDVRHGGHKQMAEWVKLYGRMPTTPVARTGGGGWHYLFQPVDWERRGKIGAGGIDVLQGNRFIVVEPSQTSGSYRWLRPPWTTPLAPLPPWLATLIRRPEPEPSRRPVDAPPGTGDTESRIRRARAYLERAEPAVSGQDGSRRTFTVAMHVALGFALDEDSALAAMADWNARCSPPWTDAALRRKIRHALQRGEMAAGSHLRDLANRPSQ